MINKEFTNSWILPSTAIQISSHSCIKDRIQAEFLTELKDQISLVRANKKQK
jgi:hypothetical protein